MLISQLMRYPHPVLFDDTDDYTDGDFSVDMRISESKTTGKVTIDYTVVLNEAHIEDLVNQGKAAVGLFVVCRRTYYNELHPLEFGSARLEFDKGELRDMVVLRPIVCSIDEIEGYSAANLHEEFGEALWSFKPADLLALGSEMVIDVGLEKLAPWETIFNLETQEDIPVGETRVSLDTDKIAIVANEETCKGIHAMRGSGAGRLALLNGVYLPAVMEVLAAISDGAGAYESRRWFRVFTAKCKHHGVRRQPIWHH
jgi:hypothetical protein